MSEQSKKKQAMLSHHVSRSRQLWNWVFHTGRFGENLTDRLSSVMASLWMLHVWQSNICQSASIGPKLILLGTSNGKVWYFPMKWCQITWSQSYWELLGDIVLDEYRRMDINLITRKSEILKACDSINQNDTQKLIYSMKNSVWSNSQSLKTN